jgi:hypothetical protein
MGEPNLERRVHAKPHVPVAGAAERMFPTSATAACCPTPIRVYVFVFTFVCHTSARYQFHCRMFLFLCEMRALPQPRLE